MERERERERERKWRSVCRKRARERKREREREREQIRPSEDKMGESRHLISPWGLRLAHDQRRDNAGEVHLMRG